jgi:hypothetical protein
MPQRLWILRWKCVTSVQYAYLRHHLAGRNGLSHELRVVALPRVCSLRCGSQQPPHAEVNPAWSLSHGLLTQSRLVAARTPCTDSRKSGSQIQMSVKSVLFRGHNPGAKTNNEEVYVRKLAVHELYKIHCYFLHS